MWEKTQELVKKFEEDYEIYVDAKDALTYWIIYARPRKNDETGMHNLHMGKKFITGPGQDGNVLVLPDPQISDQYVVESWGKMDSFDDFVKKGLARILSEKNAPDQRLEQGCGSSCS